MSEKALSPARHLRKHFVEGHSFPAEVFDKHHLGEEIVKNVDPKAAEHWAKVTGTTPEFWMEAKSQAEQELLNGPPFFVYVRRPRPEDAQNDMVLFWYIPGNSDPGFWTYARIDTLRDYHLWLPHRHPEGADERPPPKEKTALAKKLMKQDRKV